MFLKTLYIKNFRNIREITLDCESIMVLSGENNAAKPNILFTVYKLLTPEVSPHHVGLTDDDFFVDESTGVRSKEIIIEMTFGDMDQNDIDTFISDGIDILNKKFTIRFKAIRDLENHDGKVSLNFFRGMDPGHGMGSLS